MGKTKRMRQKCHIAAQNRKTTQESSDFKEPNLPDVIPPLSLNNDFFAGLNIDITKLNTKLDNDDIRSVKSYKSLKSNMQENTILPKKEKLKLRRQLLLAKLDLANQMKKQHNNKKKGKKQAVENVANSKLVPELSDTLPSLQSLMKYQTDSQITSDIPKTKKAIQKAKFRQKETLRNAKSFDKMLNLESHRNNPFDSINKHILKFVKQ